MYSNKNDISHIQLLFQIHITNTNSYVKEEDSTFKNETIDLDKFYFL